MKRTRVNRLLWLHRVLGWDGLLPLCVVLVPAIVGAVFPNKEDAICFLAVALPIIALVIRGDIGRRNIASNRVGPVLRVSQYCVFIAAIIALVFIDFMVVLIHLGPPVRVEGFYVLGAGYGLYLVAILSRCFPGGRRSLRARPTISNWIRP